MTTILHAQWIVGFTDGEGCFRLDIHIKNDMQWKLEIQPEFTVVQSEIDVQILHALKDYFKCGSVAVNRQDKYGIQYHYRVKSVKHLHETIVPFFEKHQLKTKKRIEFQRFRNIVRLMHDGYHLKSLENFLEIIDKGFELRERIRPATGQSSGAQVPGPKKTQVNKQVAELRALLQKNLSGSKP